MSWYAGWMFWGSMRGSGKTWWIEKNIHAAMPVTVADTTWWWMKNSIRNGTVSCITSRMAIETWAYGNGNGVLQKRSALSETAAQNGDQVSRNGGRRRAPSDLPGGDVRDDRHVKVGVRPGEDRRRAPKATGLVMAGD